MRPVDERQDTGEFPGFERGADPWGERTATAPEVRAVVPKARTGLVLFVAFAVQAVIILVVGNQFIANKINETRPTSLMLTGVRNAAGQIYSWRVSPPGGRDVAHQWLAATIAVPSAVVLSLLLILAVVRSSVTFWRAFFGIWMAVAVSAVLGGYVRGAIIDPGYRVNGPQPSRAEYALFGPGQPTSTTFLAGVVLGLVVALVAGIVARATRRTPEPAALTPPLPPPPLASPEQPPPFNPATRGASDDGGGPWQDRRYGPPARDERAGAAPWAAPYADESRADEQRTTALPALTHEDPDTTSTPREGTPPRETASEQDQSHATSQLPRVSETEATRADAPVVQPDEHSVDEPDEHSVDEPVEHSVDEHSVDEPVEQHADAPAEPVEHEGAAQQTAQFPRPPDDEDIEPEHR